MFFPQKPKNKPSNTESNDGDSKDVELEEYSESRKRMSSAMFGPG